MCRSRSRTPWTVRRSPNTPSAVLQALPADRRQSCRLIYVLPPMASDLFAEPPLFAWRAKRTRGARYHRESAVAGLPM